jgi:LDH2 family malate/lactate/ureidoglycolate dehydrogenase
MVSCEFMSNEFITIEHTALAGYGRAILEASGVPAATAALVAESLVASNLRGVDSHGIQLLIWYTDQIKMGNVELHTHGRVVNEFGSSMTYDGEHGIGQWISEAATDHAIRIARESGVAMVTVRDSTHFGACAWWANKIARAGFIGIVMCNATPLVAPWQGRERMLGTNPICMAVPGPETFLLDMATTTVALNRIYKAIISGDKSIPEGWAMDKDGNPTTDPQTAADGLPMPLGGYKGYGLAVMVEVLCAVLSGGAMLTELGGIRTPGKRMRASHFFMAIDVARFMPREEFVKRMEFVRDTLTHSQPAAGFDEVLIAGVPEWRTEETRRLHGVPVAKGIWDQLGALAGSLGVEVPPI